MVRHRVTASMRASSSRILPLPSHLHQPTWTRTASSIFITLFFFSLLFPCWWNKYKSMCASVSISKSSTSSLKNGSTLLLRESKREREGGLQSWGSFSSTLCQHNIRVKKRCSERSPSSGYFCRAALFWNGISPFVEKRANYSQPIKGNNNIIIIITMSSQFWNQN